MDKAPVLEGDDSSVTEPETDPETTKVARAAEKNVADDDSVTEPESEVDIPQGEKDDSETEPESESLGGFEDEEDESPSGDDAQGTRKIHIRPSFPLRPGQISLGSFVLSPSYTHRSPSTHASSLPPRSVPKARPVEVPPSINTHLRDYQRAGALFFWERYQENRGGLLGDDMGLVRSIIPR